MTCNDLNKTVLIFKTSRIPGVVLLLFFFPAVVFGSIDNGETVVHQKTTKIVYTATGNNSVVITEGRITAEYGKSIQLLPGTHLKGEQPVKASIVSRERQQALAYKAEQDRKREFYTTLLKRLKNTKPDAEAAKITGSGIPLPRGGTSLWQQSFFAAALPAQSSNSFAAPAVVLSKQTTLQNIHNLLATSCKTRYQPTTSWGNQPGNIKVMLC